MSDLSRSGSPPSSPPPSGSVDRQLRVLTTEECLDRLATERVGRVAVVVDYYPQVFCVNYVLDDFIVVFRTHLGSTLLASHHTNIGFEVDHLDHEARVGWTVLVRGMAEDVTDRVNDLITERSRHLDIQPWAPGEQARIMRVIPAKITGREIRSDDILWSSGPPR